MILFRHPCPVLGRLVACDKLKQLKHLMVGKGPCRVGSRVAFSCPFHRLFHHFLAKVFPSCLLGVPNRHDTVIFLWDDEGPNEESDAKGNENHQEEPSSDQESSSQSHGSGCPK